MNREQHEMAQSLERLGFTWDEINQLRRISMTLRRWFEKECGTDNGCIERDDETEKPYWLNAINGNRYPVADREKGARARLARIMESRQRRLVAFVQTDCRGVALYILRKCDVRGQDIRSVYNRGIAVY